MWKKTPSVILQDDVIKYVSNRILSSKMLKDFERLQAFLKINEIETNNN